MSIFSQWQKLKEFIHKNEKYLWFGHSLWALTLGIGVIIFFNGDFGQVKKLILYLMLLMLLLIAFDRLSVYETQTGKNRRGVKLVLNYIMKNMYQGLYFFMLPFYWEASVASSANIFFTLAIGVLALLSTQDLIFDNWLMENKFIRAGYYAFCLFASFNLLLPLFLPLPTYVSMTLAAFLAVLAFVLLHYPKLIFKKSHLRWVLLTGVLTAGSCYEARSLVPPAPYKISAEFITTARPSKKIKISVLDIKKIHEKDLKTRKIFWVNILESPIYPKDSFYHTWYFKGEPVINKQKVPRIKIGKGKYLMYSFIENNKIGSVNLTGKWRIQLTTGGNQLLKESTFYVVK